MTGLWFCCIGVEMVIQLCCPVLCVEMVLQVCDFIVYALKRYRMCEVLFPVLKWCNRFVVLWSILVLKVSGVVCVAGPTSTSCTPTSSFRWTRPASASSTHSTNCQVRHRPTGTVRNAGTQRNKTPPPQPTHPPTPHTPHTHWLPL